MPLAYGLIHPVDLALAELPPGLQGLRIAHLSDLHIQRHRPRHDCLISQLTRLRLDLALLTGDYMTRDKDAADAAAVLRRVVEAIRPRLGIFGVFGNHDSKELVDLTQDIGIQWLGTGMRRVPGAAIHLYGIDPLDTQAEDGVAMLLNGELPELNDQEAFGLNPPPFQGGAGGGSQSSDSRTRSANHPPSKSPPLSQPLPPGERGSLKYSKDRDCLRLMLAHYPSWLATAADLRVHMLFAGHTHGGQVRLPNRRAIINACDLPLDMSCGVLRHRDTLIAISRGLGEVGFPGTRFRAFCPPHVPVYTLRRGPTLGQNTPGLVKVVRW